jgi:hypothetical protein
LHLVGFFIRIIPWCTDPLTSSILTQDLRDFAQTFQAVPHIMPWLLLHNSSLKLTLARNPASARIWVLVVRPIVWPLCCYAEPQQFNTCTAQCSTSEFLLHTFLYESERICKEQKGAMLEVLSQIHLEEVRIPGKFSIRVVSLWTWYIIQQHHKYKQECQPFTWNIQWPTPQNLR